MKFEDYLKNDFIFYRAYLNSRNNRSYKISAMRFGLDTITNIEKLRQELINKSYEVSGYTEFTVTYPKIRNILACKFRDKIVQHILCDNILVYRLPEICIVDNYAGQKGKGTSFARDRLCEQLKCFYKKYGLNGYIFRGDITKYYYNINHKIAKEIMHKHYDEDIHWLIDKFIDSTDGDKGIALGNQINTVVSCLYLDGFDKFITNELGYQFYGRYADDFFIFDADKENLKITINKIIEYLDGLSLKLNPKSQIMPMKNGLSFLGFHFYINNGELSIKLDNGKKRAYKRKFNKMCKKVRDGDIEFEKLLMSYQSWKTHAKFCTDHSIFLYFDKRIKEAFIDMTIKDGYYVAECTSQFIPVARQDLDTFYLPVEIEQIDNGLYQYKEYRFNLPINYNLPFDLIDSLAKELNKYRKSLEEVGVL